MKQLAVSKLKVHCLAVVEEVNRTGQPVLVTRFGKPVAEIIPARPQPKESWLGSVRDEMEIVGNIVGPLGAFEDWNADWEPEASKSKKSRSK